MQNNQYDDPAFFTKYSQMTRSTQGLAGAGEWETLQSLLPDLSGKRVLDLGCGYGWHCIYAAEHGAASVLGVDLSEKMLAVAREKTQVPQVQYRCAAMEDVEAPAGSFDLVLSSLALHYVPDFIPLVQKIAHILSEGGQFIFSVEHPIFTAQGSQDWFRDETGAVQHFPVDSYFYEGERNANFLGASVTKYHKTLTTYLDGLLTNGFRLLRVVEPQPPERMRDMPGMLDELRRPMMLLVSAQKC